MINFFFCRGKEKQFMISLHFFTFLYTNWRIRLTFIQDSSLNLQHMDLNSVQDYDPHDMQDLSSKSLEDREKELKGIYYYFD